MLMIDPAYCSEKSSGRHWECDSVSIVLASHAQSPASNLSTSSMGMVAHVCNPSGSR